MNFKSSIIYSTLKTITAAGIGCTSLFPSFQAIKAENFNMVACPESGSTNATLNYIESTLEGSCLHSPDQYKLTIYAMGLCTTDPTASAYFDTTSCVETMSAIAGVEVDLAPGSSASTTAPLPSSETRPASNSYSHAYVLLGNNFKMKGSYELSDGTKYYSKEEEDSWGKYGAANKTITASEEHTDLVDNMYFGDADDGWDGVMSPTDMPGGGKVSALLLKECSGATCTGNDGLATSQGEVKRLLGVFETNSGEPVVISDNTTGVQIELVVKADPNNPSASGGGYVISGWDNGSGFDLRNFGSAPFKPVFTTF